MLNISREIEKLLELPQVLLLLKLIKKFLIFRFVIILL